MVKKKMQKVQKCCFYVAPAALYRLSLGIARQKALSHQWWTGSAGGYSEIHDCATLSWIIAALPAFQGHGAGTDAGGSGLSCSI